ncbi:hypothetical protein EIP91_003049, partial [Steccherinum ochraceum]
EAEDPDALLQRAGLDLDTKGLDPDALCADLESAVCVQRFLKALTQALSTGTLPLPHLTDVHFRYLHPTIQKIIEPDMKRCLHMRLMHTPAFRLRVGKEALSL